MAKLKSILAFLILLKIDIVAEMPITEGIKIIIQLMSLNFIRYLKKNELRSD